MTLTATRESAQVGGISDYGLMAPWPSGDTTGATDLAALNAAIAAATSMGQTLNFTDGNNPATAPTT